jgi:signal transduction histidine kinase
MSPRTVIVALLTLISILVAAVNATFAAANPAAEDAKQLLEAAVANVVKLGGDAAAKDFVTSSKWRQGATYVVLNDFTGKVLAHSANPKMVGKVMLKAKDASGKLFVQEGLNNIKATGESAIDLKWGSPVTKKIAAARIFSKRVPGAELWVSVLIFK